MGLSFGEEVGHIFFIDFEFQVLQKDSVVDVAIVELCCQLFVV
jgi:hypothetical protein